MNNKQRVNFNLSIDLYKFLKQYSKERGITFTTAVDRFLSRSIEQYQMAQVIREEVPFKEETPLREEATIPSFNGENDIDTETYYKETGLMVTKEDMDCMMEMFDDMPD